MKEGPNKKKDTPHAEMSAQRSHGQTHRGEMSDLVKLSESCVLERIVDVALRGGENQGAHTRTGTPQRHLKV